jgi:hypothetical protein
MNIRLLIAWKIKINHMRHNTEIKAPRGDIGRNQKTSLTGPQIANNPLPFRLLHVSVKRDSVVTSLSYCVGYLDRRCLGSHENDHRREIGTRQHSIERLDL